MAAAERKLMSFPVRQCGECEVCSTRCEAVCYCSGECQEGRKDECTQRNVNSGLHSDVDESSTGHNVGLCSDEALLRLSYERFLLSDDKASRGLGRKESIAKIPLDSLDAIGSRSKDIDETVSHSGSMNAETRFTTMRPQNCISRRQNGSYSSPSLLYGCFCDSKMVAVDCFDDWNPLSAFHGTNKMISAFQSHSPTTFSSSNSALEAEKCYFMEKGRAHRNAIYETRDVVDHSSFTTTGGGVMSSRYESAFSSYERFVKLYNWKEVKLCPSGLINCGNSCYANVVLQCLAFTSPLTAYFLQGLHSKDCQEKDWCFSCEFEDLIRKVKLATESSSVVSPARIMSKIDRIGTHLVQGREEDAHEFLRYATDSMQHICLKEATSAVDEETTLMGLTFGGYMRSKIECLKCGGKSEQDERMMDLAVEICGDVDTLEDALRQFTRTEILDGQNKYFCNRCKLYEKAKKKLEVSVAPNILTILLKKFRKGSRHRVKFPEILNMSPYMTGTSDDDDDKSPTIYWLYGIIVHMNALAAFNGHYICYVKNNRGRWFEADDARIEEVGIEKVLSRDAYMLFYARHSPCAANIIKVTKRDDQSHDDVRMDFGSHHNTSSSSQLHRHPNHYYVSEDDDTSSDHSSSFFSD